MDGRRETGHAAVTQHVVGYRGVTRILLAPVEQYEFLHQPENPGQCSPGDLPYRYLHWGHQTESVSPLQDNDSRLFLQIWG